MIAPIRHMLAAGQFANQSELSRAELVEWIVALFSYLLTQSG